MENCKITSKGQVTIPVSIRNELNLKTGDSVCFVKNGNEVVLKRQETIDFEKIRKSAEALGLESIEDVEKLLNDLAESRRQIERNQTIEGKELFKVLLK